MQDNRLQPTQIHGRSGVIVAVIAVAIGAILWGCCSIACGAEGTISSAPADLERTTQSEPAFLKLLSGLLHNDLLLCFAILAMGMALGSLRLAGIGFGTSGVLFAALWMGHFGKQQGWSMPDQIGTVGLVLFVYTVGLGSGTTFFRTFRQEGKSLALLGIVTVAGTAAMTFGLARWMQIPGELATGIFAGSMTSTPALASGIEAATRDGFNSLDVSIGYGMAYPAGVIGVVLFAQLLPRFLRVDLDELDRQLRATNKSSHTVERRLVRIANPAIVGRSINEMREFAHVKAQITRVLHGERLVPIKSDHVFQEGQIVLLVTDSYSLDLLTAFLGQATETPVVVDSDHERAELVIASPEVFGKPLRDLHLRSRFGVTISRVVRFEVPFVPSGDTVLNAGDRVTAVGQPEGLKAFVKHAGHRTRKLHETDLMLLAFSLVLGILVGMVPIKIFGLPGFSLGMAGGPLLVGLLLAHFGQYLGNAAYMPAAARMLIQELGLALFLADAGFRAGGSFVETFMQYGAAPFGLGLLVVATAVTIAYVFARFVLGMNLLQILGGTCGAMTSTAGVGALSGATESGVPVASYAAAYPASLVMMTLLAQVLIAVAT